MVDPSEGPTPLASIWTTAEVLPPYSTTGRGVELLVGCYGILDRAPKGRNEGGGFQLWICRHDEYDHVWVENI